MKFYIGLKMVGSTGDEEDETRFSTNSKESSSYHRPGNVHREVDGNWRG